MTEQEQSDAALAERLTKIAANLMARGSEATVGLKSLLAEIYHRDPDAVEQFHARVTLARLGLREMPTAH